MIQQYVIPLNPDAVLLAVYPENDIWNNSRALEGDESSPYFTLGEDGALVSDMSFRTSLRWTVANSPYERIKAAIVNRSRILQVIQEAKRPKTVQPKVANNSEAILIAAVNESRYVYKRSENLSSDEKKAWDVTDRLIHAIASECRRHHTSVFLVNVSSSLQAWPDPAFRKRVALACEVDDLFESEDRLRRVCEMADVPFYALASAMQQEAERSSVFLHGFPNTAKGVGHWNQQGNAIAAKLVAEWLFKQDSMLPQ